jgi:hypothetical protein
MNDQVSTTKLEPTVEENKIEETKPTNSKPVVDREYALGVAKAFLSDIGCW